MSRFCAHITLFILFSVLSYGQISPGELTNAHKDLEGVENCTKCHSVGKSLSNERCLDCHKEINARLKQKKGFHVSIGAKLCEECHKEHHGRNFQIVRFDTKAFDHSTVGFVLEGKHKKIECKDCHKKERIAAPDVQKLSDEYKKRTYMGLSTNCSSCHEDKHKGQFAGRECSSCHTIDQWKSVLKFSHDRTNYPLTGSHQKTECMKCHNKMLEDGKTVRFVKMEFSSCSNCHVDPHKGKFKQECNACHSTDDFHKISKGQFDHATTQYPLKGKHAQLKCEQCHNPNPKGVNASGEIGYRMTKFQACANCHSDAHAMQFLYRTDKGKCESCHTEEGFTIVRFAYQQHQATRFPLAGAHTAIPCGACHTANAVKAKSTRKFHWEGNLECLTCHQDIHKGQFAKIMTKGCETCHTVSAWDKLLFSHEKTKFPLLGKHAELKCEQCHKKPANGSPIKYADLRRECSSCHTDEHDGQFAVAGVTECAKCHSTASWKKVTFNHDTQARFALTGKHAGVQCMKCHAQYTVNGKKITKYKPLGLLCTDCHTDKQ